MACNDLTAFSLLTRADNYDSVTPVLVPTHPWPWSAPEQCKHSPGHGQDRLGSQFSTDTDLECWTPAEIICPIIHPGQQQGQRYMVYPCGQGKLIWIGNTSQNMIMTVVRYSTTLSTGAVPSNHLEENSCPSHYYDLKCPIFDSWFLSLYWCWTQ